MPFKKAALWTLFWFIIAMGYATGVFYIQGQEKSMEFLAGYLIEMSLSIDNLFLFLLLFCQYKIDAPHQRRILNWGIAGAVVMRLIFIVLGIELVNRFHWILYVFGVTLIITGYKMFFGQENENHIGDNWAVKLLKKFTPVSQETHGEKFFVRLNGVLHATPLFVVLLLIESTDLLFAIDSIPAVFAITTDPMIVYSSNVLAILGLRSMYFFLEKVQSMFVYVKYGVALLLVTTGLKMLVTFWGIKVSIPVALGNIAVILLGSIVLSIFFGKKETVCQTSGEG